MSFAYLPWYTGDYFRDTRHLTPARHGVYLLLLAHCWDSKGPAPLDEQECAGICNCRSADEVDAMRYILGRYFVKMSDGYYNARMCDEVAKWERISAARSKGGIEKARRQRDAVASQRAQADLSSASPRTPSPSLTPKDQDLKENQGACSASQPQAASVVSESPESQFSLTPPAVPTKPTKPGKQEALPDWLPVESWQEFTQHRREIKKPMTPLATRKMINKLDAMRKGGQNVKAVIDNAIAGGWSGVFPIKACSVPLTPEEQAADLMRILDEHEERQREKAGRA